MNVRFSHEEESQLNELAHQRGESVDSMVRLAALRMLDYDAEFRKAVQVGLDASERGDFISDDEMWARIDRILAE